VAANDNVTLRKRGKAAEAWGHLRGCNEGASGAVDCFEHGSIVANHKLSTSRNRACGWKVDGYSITVSVSGSMDALSEGAVVCGVVSAWSSKQTLRASRVGAVVRYNPMLKQLMKQCER
jgi:hypothetical protein